MYKIEDQMVHARGVVSNAIRSGRLVRPGSCEQCGRQITEYAPDGRRWRKDCREAHAIIKDPAQPLDVLWVCYWCRGKIHGARVRVRQAAARRAARQRAAFELPLGGPHRQEAGR